MNKNIGYDLKENLYFPQLLDILILVSKNSVIFPNFELIFADFSPFFASLRNNYLKVPEFCIILSYSYLHVSEGNKCSGK